MANLTIANHGGMCCGIKTIHCFGYGTYAPSVMQPAIKATKFVEDDVYYHYTTQDKNFFTDEAPEESTLDRLDRYLEFLRDRRPQHIVEVVLATPYYEDDESQKVWFPILKERGFKKVTEAVNSNSGNTCHVFHLVLSEDEDS